MSHHRPNEISFFLLFLRPLFPLPPPLSPFPSAPCTPPSTALSPLPTYLQNLLAANGLTSTNGLPLLINPSMSPSAINMNGTLPLYPPPPLPVGNAPSLHMTLSPYPVKPATQLSSTPSAPLPPCVLTALTHSPRKPASGYPFSTPTNPKSSLTSHTMRPFTPTHPPSPTGPILDSMLSPLPQP